MRVYYADPHFELDIEQDILAEKLAYSLDESQSIEVLVVHQQFVDGPYLDLFPRLKGVIRLGVGYDKVDLLACQARGIQVANIPDYCSAEVADTSLAMMLSLTRGITGLGARLGRSPKCWQNLTIKGLRRNSTLTLGVIGAGRIGTAVLERAQPFGWTRIFYDPWVSASANARRVESLATLLGQADIISLHLPLNSDTIGMINAPFIESMKTGSYLINTSRGKLLGDEGGLLNALRSGHIAGVALDVLPNEPPGQDPLISAWLQKDSSLAEKLILTPHNAFYSQEGQVELRHLAVAEAQRCLMGECFQNKI